MQYNKSGKSYALRFSIFRFAYFWFFVKLTINQLNLNAKTYSVQIIQYSNMFKN